MTKHFERLCGALPDAAREIGLNLHSVLEPGPPLSNSQRWGVAIAAALASRNCEVSMALVADARAVVGEEVVADAMSANSLMAMNNVYYRFRHMIGKDVYAARSPRLRVQGLAQPATDRGAFELLSLAASAINGCSACLVAHEQAALAHGLTEDHVHETVRIAAAVHGAAVAIEAASAVGLRPGLPPGQLGGSAPKFAKRKPARRLAIGEKLLQEGGAHYSCSGCDMEVLGI